MAESGPWSQHKERGAGAGRIILITAAAHWPLFGWRALRLSTARACLPGVANQCPYSEVTPRDRRSTRRRGPQRPAMGRQDCVAISSKSGKGGFILFVLLFFFSSSSPTSSNLPRLVTLDLWHANKTATAAINSELADGRGIKKAPHAMSQREMTVFFF